MPKIRFDDGKGNITERASALDFGASRYPDRPTTKSFTQLLDEDFEALPLPVREAFASDYAIIRVLNQARKYELAMAHLKAVAVPANLEAVKAALLARFPNPTATPAATTAGA